MSNGVPQSSRFTFCHPLLHARDWQHRPQLDDLCRWWTDGGSGVCALIGIGGAGKTAIADRFLQVLPDVMPPRPDLPKRMDLSPPQRLFVFSFYDAPNPDSFFASLFNFLNPRAEPQVTRSVSEDEAEFRPASYQQTLIALQSSGPSLLVLDGLEKVQDDGVRDGVFGDLLDGRLNDLLVRIAEGTLRHVSVVITSRFPLAKLDDRRSAYYRPIEVEQIDLKAAVSLLKQRGVRGTDDQLSDIARDCGLHALTVDLTGGYIVEFGDGNPATPVQLTHFDDEEQARRAEPTNSRRRHVRLQEFRFARIADSYRDGFKAHDPAALALLERICLFRLGVDAKTLAKIFTGEGEDKQRIAGPILASLTREQLQNKLDRLVAMNLIEIAGGATSDLPNGAEDSYSIHPAVRDGIQAGLDTDTRRHGHEAARAEMDSVLGNTPGSNPSASATLDLLEEILFHTLEIGEVEQAWRIYKDRMGGESNLDWRLSLHQRGKRICKRFLMKLHSEDQPCIKLDDHTKCEIFTAAGTYLMHLGELTGSIHCLNTSVNLHRQNRTFAKGSFTFYTFAFTKILSGGLTEVVRFASEFIHSKDRSTHGTKYFELHVAAAYAAGMCGALSDANNGFVKAENSLGSTNRPLGWILSVWHADVYSRMGRFTVAKQILHANIEFLRGKMGPNSHDIQKSFLLLAYILLANDTVSEAKRHLDEVKCWLLNHDERETECVSMLVGARIERLAMHASMVAFGTYDTASSKVLIGLIAEGIRIAHACGFGLYHIELVLERARLHLLCANPKAALVDLQLALDNGVSANAHTGQPELLAATHPDCGYAWAIAEGLSLRGEALLLQAAQLLGKDSFVPAKRDSLPADVRDSITQAETCLTQVLDHWHSLRDTEPNNANFVHPTTGIEYNYRATETDQILNDLAGGLLTRFPIRKGLEMSEKRKVFVSHSSYDKPFVRRFVDALEQHHLEVWFDEREMGLGDSIVQGISGGLTNADYLLVVLSPNSAKSKWVQNELNAAMMEETSKKGIVVLPAVIEDCEIPILLRDRIYADFRAGFDKGLNGLLRVFAQEKDTAQSTEPSHISMFVSSDCKSNLSGLKLAELRRRMSKRMSRSEVGTVWFDVLELTMDNDMQGRTLTDCVVELLDRAKNRNKLADVIESVCSDRADVGNP